MNVGMFKCSHDMPVRKDPGMLTSLVKPPVTAVAWGTATRDNATAVEAPTAPCKSACLPRAALMCAPTRSDVKLFPLIVLLAVPHVLGALYLQLQCFIVRHMHNKLRQFVANSSSFHAGVKVSSLRAWVGTGVSSSGSINPKVPRSGTVVRPRRT
jgi:hypothetical protein